MNESNEQDTRRDFFKAAGTVAGAAAFASLLGAGSAEAHEVEVNALGPTPEQMAAFAALPSGPVSMVNLIKFSDAGGGSDYGKYGIEVGKLLRKIGAELVFSGQCKGTLIGGATWDIVTIMRYPDKTDLIKMTQSPEYQAIHHHREAGLKGQGQMLLAVFENNALPESLSADTGGSENVTPEQLMGRMDANGDGKIDMTEAPDQLKGSFGMIDANSDGGIDVTEAQTIADFINNQ